MRRAAFYLLAAAVVAADQISKAWAVETLASGRVIPVIPGYLVFNLVHNRGSAFGLIQGGAPVLAVVALVAVALIVYLERRGLTQRILRLAVALQLGGAIGNLIDRARLHYVVDFIELDWKGRNIWPVFNVADMAITVGTALLVGWLLWGGKEHPPPVPAVRNDVDT